MGYVGKWKIWLKRLAHCGVIWGCVQIVFVGKIKLQLNFSSYDFSVLIFKKDNYYQFLFWSVLKYFVWLTMFWCIRLRILCTGFLTNWSRIQYTIFWVWYTRKLSTKQNITTFLVFFCLKIVVFYISNNIFLINWLKWTNENHIR